jgi:hypothetical protein
MVSSFLNCKSVSSMLTMEIGSNPGQGSSSMRTSGSKVKIRAIQSHCCCPPGSRRAEVCKRSLTSPQRTADQSAFSTVSFNRFFRFVPLSLGP